MALLSLDSAGKSFLVFGYHLKYGDEWFEKNEFYEALLEYNTALRYASHKSSNSGIAYYQRAAVYFECKKYAQSVENLQWTRECNPPENVIELLNKYEAQCRLKMEEEVICEKLEVSIRLTESKTVNTDEKFDPWSFFKLSRPANEKIPFIINDLKLRENDKFGRHIITTTELKVGEIVAIEEQFYMHMDDPNHSKYWSRCVCSYCFKSSMLNLIPCHNCSTVMYCSRECQEKHEWHKIECDHEASLTRLSSPIFGLLFKSYFIEGNEWQEVIKGEEKTVFDFDLSDPDDPMYQKNLLVAINSLSMNFKHPIYHPKDRDLVSKTNKNTIKKITDLKLIFKTNGIEIKKPLKFAKYYSRGDLARTQSYGTALLPFGSLFNHSCFPNVKTVAIDNKVVFYVGRPIAAGAQLFINYGVVSNYDSHETRKKALKSYQFTCGCGACYQKCQLNRLPTIDRKFREPDFRSCPPQEAIEQFKRNCRYIQSKRNQLCKEVVTLMGHNDHLLHGVVKNSFVLFDALMF